MKSEISSVISAFGVAAKAKLASAAPGGEPEEQLRAPFEALLADMAELTRLPREHVVAIGEARVNDLKTRPDFAVTAHGALVGYVEIKAPGKGADPRKFKDAHDRSQWEKLKSLPNLIYTDGNAFSRWENGERKEFIQLAGDIETSGDELDAPPGLLALFENFLGWNPIAPRSAKELAHVSARLCRLLRDEVTEQLARKSEALTSLAEDWRKLLFPEASDKTFADGYAQAVTFGLLMARARGIPLDTGFAQISAELATTSTLIGAALRLLTDSAENQATLKTSLRTLTRVLDAVDWPQISKGRPEAWLYFYEDFLEEYDKALRKLTGSYYTPPEVVSTMTRLVDEALRSSRFGEHAGLASANVTLADPATGTGTFLLGVLRQIAENVRADEGEGAVASAIEAAVQRLTAFEMQLGPFAVAQLRILAEIVELTGAPPRTAPRMFVTDTLGNPFVEQEWLPTMYRAIGESYRAANRIKREEPITVVIGNPPYKEKAKGRGGWVEGENRAAEKAAPLAEWMPPRAWGVGVHAKHLRNLYVYFWRWATWKVFDHGPGPRSGIVCFITVAGFLSGPGFQKMRDYLRRTCDDIWVIDCSPEGHQPEVPTRIFQGVQQPVCIVLASRSAKGRKQGPAKVRFRAVPAGRRTEKFAALAQMTLTDEAWIECPTDGRAPFLPASKGDWSTFPKLEDLFIYNGGGVQPKRVWVIAPDAQSLVKRWQHLLAAKAEEKEDLFHATLRGGKPADRHIRSVVRHSLPGYAATPTPLAEETRECLPPVRYGFRSFNRQWIIPDARVITQPNAELWASLSDQQVFLTAFTEESPTNGPALTFTGLVPDLHHYKGSFGGRVFPLWRDAKASVSNVEPMLLSFLAAQFGAPVSPEDVLAYIAAVAAHPGYTARFQNDLTTPGLRIPFTADAALFAEAAALGRTVIWLHTFGERMADPAQGRPTGPPRLPLDRRPRIPANGAIPSVPMPNSIIYNADRRRLLIGRGFVENVTPAIWRYEVSGKQVLPQWFSYRKKERDRPLIGDRREPSPLGQIQPDYWLAEYSTELVNVLNVLGWLVELEPSQAALLEKICTGSLLDAQELRAQIDSARPDESWRIAEAPAQPDLFSL